MLIMLIEVNWLKRIPVWSQAFLNYNVSFNMDYKRLVLLYAALV